MSQPFQAGRRHHQLRRLFLLGVSSTLLAAWRPLCCTCQGSAGLRRRMGPLRPRRIGVDARLVQPLQLEPALLFLVGQFFAHGHSIAVILTSIVPFGVEKETRSPTLWAISALPSGDAFEIRPLVGSASAEPTIA